MATSRSYEKPTVETLSASELLEILGPVQGYSGPGGNNDLSTVAGGGGSGTRHISR